MSEYIKCRLLSQRKWMCIECCSTKESLYLRFFSHFQLIQWNCIITVFCMSSKHISDTWFNNTDDEFSHWMELCVFLRECYLHRHAHRHTSIFVRITAITFKFDLWLSRYFFLLWFMFPFANAVDNFLWQGVSASTLRNSDVIQIGATCSENCDVG